jgi:hypothetical protein
MENAQLLSQEVESQKISQPRWPMTSTRKPVVVSAPNGLPIVGTPEVCPCRSRIAQFWRNRDGTLDFDYGGASEMFFEEQRIVQRRRERVFLDEQGNEWRESQLIVIEAASFAIRNGGN